MSLDPAQVRWAAGGLLAALYLVWAGLIAGVSFISTPVKFQAEHLTMPVALEIGRETFRLFNRVEWGVLALAVVLSAIRSGCARRWWPVVGLGLLLAVQTFWLLPALHLRTDAVIAGMAPSPGRLHWLYIGADVIKLFGTLVSAWFVARKVGE